MTLTSRDCAWIVYALSLAIRSGLPDDTAAREVIAVLDRIPKPKPSGEAAGNGTRKRA